ncbi:MAG: EamA family transporter, partial [Methylophilaceae bacterium]|nr:EamA family transporter [Methylophilaceae bacterium]
VLCNALAWLLWLYALQRLEAGVASMVTLLAPVIGVLAAWIELSEQPSHGELWGILFIIVSLVIISIRGMKKHQAVDPAMGQE